MDSDSISNPVAKEAAIMVNVRISSSAEGQKAAMSPCMHVCVCLRGSGASYLRVFLLA